MQDVVNEEKTSECDCAYQEQPFTIYCSLQTPLTFTVFVLLKDQNCIPNTLNKVNKVNSKQ